MSRRSIGIVATKSNLLRLREHYGFIVSGHALLDQKREVLLEQLVEMYREAQQLRREVEGRLATLYGVLRQAVLAGGREPLEAEALAGDRTQLLRVRERSVMGVVIPLLELEPAGRRVLAAAPGWGPAGATRIAELVGELLLPLVRLAEVETSCRRLANALENTRRKVNALENVFLPEYRDTIRFIESSLEEREREAHFQRKRLQDRRRRSEGEA